MSERIRRRSATCFVHITHCCRTIRFVALCALFAPIVGCQNCDLVEAELRTKESELRNLRGELHRREAYDDAMQRELHAIPPVVSSPITPELASQTYTLQEVVLGRGTGGFDDDNCPGDEALQVVLEPRDPDGHAIKAPGTLQVEVLQITPEGLKLPLSVWDVPAEGLRRTWRSGLWSSGYVVVLPWKTLPTYTKLRVIARFTLADGRAFEADKDVTVHLPSAPRVPAETLPLPQPQPNSIAPAATHSAPAALILKPVPAPRS